MYALDDERIIHVSNRAVWMTQYVHLVSKSLLPQILGTCLSGLRMWQTLDRHLSEQPIARCSEPPVDLDDLCRVWLAADRQQFLSLRNPGFQAGDDFNPDGLDHGSLRPPLEEHILAGDNEWS